MLPIFGNTVVNSTASWFPEPAIRGTWTILSSCLITTSLWVWTVVHLNIPKKIKEPRQAWRKLGWLTKYDQTRRRLGWLILGIIAPEMVTFTAWDQYREAKKLFVDVRNDLGQDVIPS